jgi:hypothetical protein
MEKYRRKEEVLVWQWTGDESVIAEIKQTIEPYGDRFKVGLSTDVNILAVSTKRNEGYDIFTSTDYVRKGEYVVLDFSNEVNPFGQYNEEWLNKKYTKI